MPGCQKHDATMEKIFISLSEISTDVKLIRQNNDEKSKRIDKIEVDLYDQSKGLMSRFTEFKAIICTKVKSSSRVVWFLVLSNIGTAAYIIKKGMSS